MYVRISRAVAAAVKLNNNALHVRQMSFFERDPKSGYRTKKEENSSIIQTQLWHVKNGLRMLGDELKLFKKEVIEHFENDPLLIFRKDEVDPVWQFNGDKKSLEQWVVTADSDHEEGYSSCR